MIRTADLNYSIHYGTLAGMNRMRKIMVSVSKKDLAAAQALTGKGVTETIQECLKQLVSFRAQQRALALRGKVKFSMTIDEMRHGE